MRGAPVPGGAQPIGMGAFFRMQPAARSIGKPGTTSQPAGHAPTLSTHTGCASGAGAAGPLASKQPMSAAGSTASPPLHTLRKRADPAAAAHRPSSDLPRPVETRQDRVMDFRPPTFPEQFNLAEYYLSARIAEGRGERTAIIAGQRRLSYLDVEYMANGAAFMLRHWGVEYEDRVLLALPDSPEFAAAFFGVLKCGAVVTMVNTELPSDDYAYYLEY